MARAICTQCGNEFRWYGGRGQKLSDVTSPCCSAAAKGKTAGISRPSSTGSRIEIRDSQHPKDRTWDQRWDSPHRMVAKLEDGGVLLTRRLNIYHPTETIVNGWRMFQHGRVVIHKGFQWADVILIKESDWIKIQQSA